MKKTKNSTHLKPNPLLTPLRKAIFPIKVSMSDSCAQFLTLLTFIPQNLTGSHPVSLLMSTGITAPKLKKNLPKLKLSLKKLHNNTLPKKSAHKLKDHWKFNLTPYWIWESHLKCWCKLSRTHLTFQSFLWANFAITQSLEITCKLFWTLLWLSTPLTRFRDYTKLWKFHKILLLLSVCSW